MYLLAEGDTVKCYPYNLGLLIKDNPSTSFVLDMTDDELAEWGVFPVQAVAAEYDVFTETPVEGQPTKTNGVWQQNWIIRQATTEEIQERKESGANYTRFYDELLISTLYQEIRAQAAQSLPLTLACTEFIAAFGDAKAGRPNINAIQACLNNILDSASLDNDQIADLRTLMQDCGLLNLFILPNVE